MKREGMFSVFSVFRVFTLYTPVDLSVNQSQVWVVILVDIGKQSQLQLGPVQNSSVKFQVRLNWTIRINLYLHKWTFSQLL